MGDPQRGTDFLPKTGSRQPVCRPLNTGFGSCNITADRCQAAAGIFDQGADYHIGSEITRFVFLYKFPVTVIYHDKDVAADFFDKPDDIADIIRR